MLNNKIFLCFLTFALSTPGQSKAKTGKKNLIPKNIARKVQSLLKKNSKKDYRTSYLTPMETYELWTSPNRYDVFEISANKYKKSRIYFARFKRGRTTLYSQTVSASRFHRLKRNLKDFTPVRGNSRCEYPMSTIQKTRARQKQTNFCYMRLARSRQKKVRKFVRQLERLFGIRSPQ